jgi:hypothetical protein
MADIWLAKHCAGSGSNVQYSFLLSILVDFFNYIIYFQYVILLPV